MLVKRFCLLFLLGVIYNDIKAVSTSTVVVTNVFSGGEHLEGPHYVGEENALYFVDTSQQRVHRLDIETGNVTMKQIDYGEVGLVVRVKDSPKLLVVSSKSELFFMPWDNTTNATLTQLTAVDVDLPKNRINDGKVDAKGRLWFGTMGEFDEVAITVEPDQGSLYMINKENYTNPETKAKPITISNGIAWSADNLTMFYIDSTTFTISAFDFDLDQGSITNRRSFFNLTANNITGFPDGMTIDTDDNLYVACYTGGMVIKINSTSGELLDKYSLPVSLVTSVMWGGPNLDTLYVTTSKLGMNSTQLALEPQAGSLFAIENTGSSGYPQHQFIFGDNNI